tara:strand:+ start:490 stop:612 length:123 start_codon:yes stop_codon:yes gene_type:complete
MERAGGKVQRIVVGGLGEENGIYIYIYIYAFTVQRVRWEE